MYPVKHFLLCFFRYNIFFKSVNEVLGSVRTMTESQKVLEIMSAKGVTPNRVQKMEREKHIFFALYKEFQENVFLEPCRLVNSLAPQAKGFIFSQRRLPPILLCPTQIRNLKVWESRGFAPPPYMG